MSEELRHLFGSERLASQFSFLIEVDKLKQILRKTVLIDGSRQENDAEHSWHLALTALILQEYARETFSMKRVLTMLIIHDLVEIYAGDTFAFDFHANEDKAYRENQAAQKLFGMLPLEQGTEIQKLWEEFEAMKTPDARYAAAMDRIQPFLHNMFTNGHTWTLGQVNKEMVLARSGMVCEVLPDLAPFIKNGIQQGIEKGWIKKE